MIRRPPTSPPTYTLSPSTSHSRSTTPERKHAAAPAERQMLSECGCHTVDVAQFACLLDGRRNRRRRWCDRPRRLARQAENPQRPARDLTAVVELGLAVRRRFSTPQPARDETPRAPGTGPYETPPQRHP